MSLESLRQKHIRESEGLRWYKIPGIMDQYEINELGLVRRLYQNKKEPKILSTYIKTPKKGARYATVHVVTNQGKRVQAKVSRLMGITFMNLKKNQVITHRDGMILNNELENLMITTRESLGRKSGALGKRHGQICRISRNGEILQVWNSSRKAMADTHYNYQTILDRCNRKKVRDEFHLDGTSFRWMDNEEKLEKELAMLREAALRKPGDPIPEEDWEW